MLNVRKISSVLAISTRTHLISEVKQMQVWLVHEWRHCTVREYAIPRAQSKLTSSLTLMLKSFGPRDSLYILNYQEPPKTKIIMWGFINI